MAIDPRELARRVSSRARGMSTVPDAPRTLGRLTAPPPRSAPVRESPDLVALHHGWARIHDPARLAGESPGGTGLLIRIRRRMHLAAPATQARAIQEDRNLIGHLIRTADSLATRCDELSLRLDDLHGMLEEVVAVVSEDLTRAAARLATHPDNGTSVSDQSLGSGEADG
ncbi:MAG: hypothetical protein ACYCTL_00035 [Acidimicrobiales bacterium]